MNENNKYPSDREIFDKIAEKIAQAIDKAARQESITVSLVDYCDEDYTEEAFGAEVDFADELPLEFPQEIAGVYADEPEDTYLDNLFAIIRSESEKYRNNKE